MTERRQVYAVVEQRRPNKAQELQRDDQWNQFLIKTSTNIL